MYRQRSKRMQLFTRLAVYLVMLVAIGLLLAGSILYLLGYHFDSTGNRVEQGGLVQYLSTPSGAQVTVDGQTLGSVTPAKSSVQPGRHTFVMSKQGYEPWQKTMTIKGGTLTWLNYARLVPTERTPDSLLSVPSLASALSSPSRETIATLPDAAVPTVAFYDLRGDTPKTTSVTIADTMLRAAKKKTDRYQVVEWDSTSRYLLVKRTAGTSVEWLVVDSQTPRVIGSITKTIDIDITDAHFGTDSGRLVYVLTGGDVRKVDLGAETLSRPLATEVDSFSVYDGRIVSYVSSYDKKTKQRHVGIVRDNRAAVTIYTSTSLPAVPLRVAAGRYFNKDYVVVSDGSQVRLWGGSFPGSDGDVARLTAIKTMSLKRNVQQLQLSPASRFLVAQYDGAFVSYDIERGTISPAVKVDSSARALRWLDDFTMWTDAAGTLDSFEFDGTNKHSLMQVASGLDVLLTRNDKYLYGFVKTGKTFELQRLRMTLN